MGSQNISVPIHLIQFFLLLSPAPRIPPPPLLSSSLPLSLSLQTYGSLHYRWVCLRRQAKALRVWWILYIIKLHFFSIPTSLHYKGNQPQRPYERKCEQRATAGFFWARLKNQTIQSIKNQKIFNRHAYMHSQRCLVLSQLSHSFMVSFFHVR